jgi:hypothetical protein
MTGYMTMDGARIGSFSWDVPDPTPDGPDEWEIVLCFACAGTGMDCAEGDDGRLHYVACDHCGGSGDLPDWEALRCEEEHG